jgi:nucleotide-binding universal stress UspA family protein
MSYKTIVVHLHDTASAQRVLQSAVDLAGKFGAHLIGLHASPAMVYAPTLPGSGRVVSRVQEYERSVTEQITTTFENMTKGQAFVAELRLLRPRDADDLGALVLQHSRSCDLIVASQREGLWEMSRILDFPERLVMESGRPVFIVPLAGQRSTEGHHVMIAWNGKREAARATFDALPLLHAARRVSVLAIEQTDAGAVSARLPDTAIAAALARHDINVTIKTASADKSSVGDAIAKAVAAERVDSLVMGAYGHTRLREFVFGGATRHMLQSMPVPVLLAH